MTGQFSIEWVISENRYDSILGDIFGCIHRCLIMIRMHTIHNQCLCISNIGSDLMKRKKLKTIIVFLKHPQFVLGFAFNLKIETFPECLTTCNIIRPHAASSQIPQGIRLLLIDMKYEKKIILFRFFLLSATKPIHNYWGFCYTSLLLFRFTYNEAHRIHSSSGIFNLKMNSLNSEAMINVRVLHI